MGTITRSGLVGHVSASACKQRNADTNDPNSNRLMKGMAFSCLVPAAQHGVATAASNLDISEVSVQYLNSIQINARSAWVSDGSATGANLCYSG
jgi:hypothetical protein